MQSKPTVTKQDIIDGLKQLGLKAGDDVIVHSALTSFGRVEGGADTLIDALLELLTEQGTLLMPCFGSQPLDIENTPTNLGTVPETFRKRNGVLRSRHPLSSVAAYGKRAKYYVENHEQNECPYTEGSPYVKLAENDGYILLLGVDQDRNTTLHSVEALAKAPYMTPKKGKWIDENGNIREKEYKYCAGPHRNFIGVDPILREKGICKTTKIGNCLVRLMKSKEVFDLLVPMVRENPFLFLSDSEDYWAGVWQKGLVRKIKLQEHNINLIAQTSALGSNIEDVFWFATLAGTDKLEIDSIDGKDIALFDDEELKILKQTLEKRKFSAKIIRCCLNAADSFEKYINAAKILNANSLVIPLAGTIEQITEKAKLAADAKLNLLVENIALGSSEVCSYLEKLDKSISLAFNPAEFAKAGELPFLKSFRTRTIKKRIGYVLLSDIDRNNQPKLPGRGKAELNEIISILHAASFDGPIVITRSFGTNDTDRQLIEAIWNILIIAGVDMRIKQ